MKKIVSVVLALVLICSAFCVTAFAGSGKIGDANGDDKLSAVDARMILQHVANVKPIEDTSNLDVSQDGKISAVDARIILQVHDEIILEASRSDAERAAELLSEAMRGAADLSVPLDIEILTGENWLESK